MSIYYLAFILRHLSIICFYAKNPAPPTDSYKIHEQIPEFLSVQTPIEDILSNQVFNFIHQRNYFTVTLKVLERPFLAYTWTFVVPTATPLSLPFLSTVTILSSKLT